METYLVQVVYHILSHFLKLKYSLLWAQLLMLCWILDDDTKEVSGHPRILCFVLLKPGKLEEGRAVRQTWGARCDKMVIFSSQQGQ